MAQSILLRSLLLHRQSLLLPRTIRLRSLAGLHLGSRAGQQSKSVLDDVNKGSALEESRGDHGVSTDVRPIGEKIKENTKTASYTAIILAGLGVTGIMFYAIFRELFSKDSSSNIYSKALKLIVEDPRVQDALGAPIKGFGETSRRGRRHHVAHSSFERNGVPHMRMQFYVQGMRNKATVHLESRRDSNGKLGFRYLFVKLDHYPHTTIVLEDNRAFDQMPERSTTAFGNLSLMSNNGDK